MKRLLDWLMDAYGHHCGWYLFPTLLVTEDGVSWNFLKYEWAIIHRLDEREFNV